MKKDAAERRSPPEELTLTRIFDAPPKVVFDAWIDPRQLEQWWGPGGFTTTLKTWDPRPGGAILLDMNAPNGVVYPMGGEFMEVSPPGKLAFKSSALDEEGIPIFENMNVLVFAEEGGKTRLTLHVRVLSKRPGADQYLKGMKAGWTQSLDRLGGIVIGRSP